MLQNPIHLRLERLESWQHVTFMACLCERMYPNYAMFCKQTEFGDGQIYRRILDLIWETLTVKDAKVNFDSQLEKFEEAIPAADDYDLYGVYPAIDACVALSELMHSRLSGETLEHAIEVSKTSITTVAMLEMTQAGREMTDEELKTNPAVEQEWDIQWEIFRLLADCEERELPLAIAATPIKAENSAEIQPLVDVEKEIILAALEKTGGNKTEAARQLGITRKTLLAKLSR